MSKRTLLAALVALAWTAPAIAGEADGEAVAIEWLKTAARPVSGPEPAPAEIAPLVAQLSDARIIGIGEATHGTHEDQAFKAALIRELVQAGAVSALALEANRTAGEDFNRYVQGESDDLDAAIRTPSFFRIWRDEEFAGLIAWLREWNAGHPDKRVRVFGIDVQDGAGDAAHALEFIQQHKPELASQLAGPLTPILSSDAGASRKVSTWIAASRPGEVAPLLAGAAALVAAFEDNAASWSAAPGYADARYSARAAWQNVHSFELDVGDTALASLPPDYISRRDRYMAENLMARLAPGERAAFWAHDMHVWDTLPPEAVAAGYATVGSVLEADLGPDYRTVGFTWSQATVLTASISGTSANEVAASRTEGPVPLLNNRHGELGAVFARAFPNEGASAVYIDVAGRPRSDTLDAWAAQPYWRGWAGGFIDPTKWQIGEFGDFPVPTGQGHDVLVWFRKMTPSHRLPDDPPQ